MWALKNKTPYAAERSWVRDKTGAHLWVVAVKATFDVGPGGKMALADEQLPPLLAPEFWGDPATTSVRFDADVVPTKPTTDVLVEATAHSPKGRPVTKLVVGVRVADVEKSVVVHGARVYYRGASGQLTTTEGTTFTSRPIRYEEAYGGTDAADPDPRRQRMDLRNPVGKGVAADDARLVNQPAHAIEYPNGAAEKRGPAGFGPIASFWSPRREHAGTYDRTWEQTKKPLLPDDYDDRFLLAAPVDQRTARHLTGNEPVTLTNLTPDETLSFSVPKVFLTFSTRFGRRREEHRGRLGTILLLPDQRRVVVVWQTALVVKPSETEYLDETIIDEKAYLA